MIDTQYQNKKVLVTGGCGFIGSNLVKRLVKLGAHVLIIDNLFTGSINNLLPLKRIEDYDLSVISVATHAQLAFWVKRSDIMFHLAARNIIASTKSPREDCETNIIGTLNALLAMREATNCTRMVYTSSASVYGNPRYLPINEDDRINILTPYAASKYGGESYCMAFNESYDVPVTVLRLSNVYGVGQSITNPYCGVVAKFMDKARKKETIEVHGDGLSTRDFTYIDDVVEALLLAGISSKADGEVFNIATGIETSVNDLANEIIRIAGPKYDATLSYNHDVDVYPRITHINRRDIDNIRRRVLNTEKIRRRLDWSSITTLQDGLLLTKKWMDTNG